MAPFNADGWRLQAFRFGPEAVEQEGGDAADDGGIGDVEDVPGIAEGVGVDEIDDVAEAEAVEDVADRAADDGAEGAGDEGGFGAGEPVGEGGNDGEGDAAEEPGAGGGVLVEEAEGDALVLYHGEVEEGEAGRRCRVRAGGRCRRPTTCWLGRRRA